MEDVPQSEEISNGESTLRPPDCENGFIGPVLPPECVMETVEPENKDNQLNTLTLIDIASSDDEISEKHHDDISTFSSCEGFEYKINQSREIFKIETPFATEGFLKGCKWSCQGDKFLTCGQDRSLYLFDLKDDIKEKIKDEAYAEPEEIMPSKIFLEGGLVYDYVWNPTTSDSFVCAGSGSPAHLYCAKTGNIQATYIGYDYAYEVAAPHSVAFSWQGDRVYCGYNGEVKRFHTGVPSVSSSFNIRKVIGPRAMVSCIASNPAFEEVWAAGSYNGYVGLFNEEGANVCLFVPKFGVTHICFSKDGSKVFTGFRRSNEILCWDLRQTGRVLFSMQRVSETGQRIFFDLTPNDRYLISGSRDCSVKVWDLQEAFSNVSGSEFDLKPKYDFVAHSSCVNGISIHPNLPLMLTSTGERELIEVLSDEEDERLFVRKSSATNGTLSVWQIGF